MITVQISVCCDTCGTPFETSARFSEPIDGTLHLEQFGYWEVVEMAQDAGWSLSLEDNAVFCPNHSLEDGMQAAVVYLKGKQLV